jgi:hypothetical protein
MATKVIICPPPPAVQSGLSTAGVGGDGGFSSAAVTAAAQQPLTGLPASPGSSTSGFNSPAWQGWFSQVYNQLKGQFVTTNAVADNANGNASTALANANAALAQANAAIAGLGAKLNRSAADVLSGAVNVLNGGGFVAGTLTWDTAGNRTGGYGTAMTPNGIAAYAPSGTPTFAIDSSGNAYFAGSLGAASGTFSGTLISVNGTFTGTLTGTTITGLTVNGGTIQGGTFQTNSTGQRAVMNSLGLSCYDGGNNLIFQANQTGVYASVSSSAVAPAGDFRTASNTSGAALSAQASGSAAALNVTAGTGDGIKLDGRITTIARAGGVSNAVMNSVIAVTDNAYQCGFTGARWANVYAANGTIITSDERLKENFAECEFGLDMVLAVTPYQYTMKIGQNIVSEDGDGNPVVTPRKGERIKYGWKAQDVKAFIGDRNLSMWSLEDKDDPESIQSLTPTELIPVLWKAVRELKAEVDQLKAAAASAVAGGGV